MIKILPLQPLVDDEIPRNVFFLEVELGYGEHSDDAFSESRIIIDDEKAKYQKEHLDDDDYIYDETYITADEAEKMYIFFQKIIKKYNNDHITLNKGIDEHWFRNYYNMTEEDIEEFSEYYGRFCCELFSPKISNNWYGLRNCSILYYDENGLKHECEVV